MGSNISLLTRRHYKDLLGFDEVGGVYEGQWPSSSLAKGVDK